MIEPFVEATENETAITAEQKNLAAVHKRALERFKKAEEADREQAKLAAEDLKFGAGDQWDSLVKTKREADGRPCLVINLMEEKLNQVKGEQRMNKARATVIPYDDDADPETAEVFDGHIRAIMNNSGGNIAVDNAFDSMVDCGRGAFRVITEREDPYSMDQVIKVQWIQNVFSVKWDPGAQEYDKQDGRYFFIYQDILLDDYKEEFGDMTPPTPMPSDYVSTLPQDLLTDWKKTDSVRVAEYFERTTEKFTLAMIEGPDGRPKGIDKKDLKADDKPVLSPSGKPLERESERRVITWYLMNGAEILAGPLRFPSKYFPIFLMFGRETNINGKRYVRGMIRPGRDPQLIINYAKSKNMEVLAMQPTAPFQGTPEQFAGHEDAYAAAAGGGVVTMLPFNNDASRPQGDKPTRVTPPMMSSGFAELEATCKEDLKGCMGMYDSAIGAQGNETSGKAILAREQQSNRGTFHYKDNCTRTLHVFYRCLIDMIPRIYDADRTVRILGRDNKARAVHYGQRPDGYSHEGLPPEERIYDPLVGKYDVTVSEGPDFATQRQEIRESLMEVTRSAPGTAPIIISNVVRMMDFPDSDKLADEIELLLPLDVQMRLKALRDGVKQGLPLDAAANAPQILGPDGLPIQMPAEVGLPEEMAVPEMMMPEEAPGTVPEQAGATVDPIAKARALAEQAKTVEVLLTMRKKMKDLGYTDQEIDAIAAGLEAAA